MTTVTSRRPRRRGPTRPGGALGAGIVVLALIIGVAYIAERSYNGLPFVDYKTYYASLPNIGHLQPHDEVRMSGVHVGQILETETDGGRARVKLQLEPGVGTIPADSRAVVRANGLLGSRYLQLELGRSDKPLPDGATITGGADSYRAGVPETLDLFDAETRGALGRMVRGIGDGLLGRGEGLNTAIPAIVVDEHYFRKAANDALSRPGAVSRLLPSIDGAMTAFDAARPDFIAMLRPGARALKPFADRRAAFRAALDEAPATLVAVQSGFGAGRELLGSVRALASAARGTLPEAPAALNAATRLLTVAPRPLRRTELVLDELPTAVPTTLRTLRSLQPNLKPLKEAFVNLTDPARSLGEHGCDLRAFSENWHGVFGVATPAPESNYGPLGEFRVTLVAGSQAIGPLASLTTFEERGVYKKPCHHVPGPVYPIVDLPSLTPGSLAPPPKRGKR